MNKEHVLYLDWEVKVIVADHSGYCSGAENDEEIETDNVCCSYLINEEEYKLIQTLTEKDFLDILNNDVREDIVPIFENDSEGVVGGESGYCGKSEHGLRHERMRIPISVTGFSFTEPDSDVDIEDCGQISFHNFL